MPSLFSSARLVQFVAALSAFVVVVGISNPSSAYVQVPGVTPSPLQQQLMPQCESWIEGLVPILIKRGVIIPETHLGYGVIGSVYSFADTLLAHLGTDKSKLTEEYSFWSNESSRRAAFDDRYWENHYYACILAARGRQLGINIGRASTSTTAPTPQRSQPAPRAPVQAPPPPVQAPPPVAQIPPPDPAIVPMLRQIESYRGRCAQERAGAGDERVAILLERKVASDATRQTNWQDQLLMIAGSEKMASEGGSNAPLGRYLGCLFKAHGNRLRASSPLSPDELAGQRIVQSLGNACSRERAATAQAGGSNALQEYYLLRNYRAMAEINNNRDALVKLDQDHGLAHTGGEPAESTAMAYLHCLAQARLAQMDSGTSLRGGGRESGAHEPDRSGTVIASAPQNPYPKQSGDKNYLTEDGKPCITAQAMPTEVHDDGWRNYVIEYTNVCPRIIVIYSRWIQDGPLVNTDGVQSGGIGEGSKSQPAKMSANCVNDPKHRANACAGYSEWWVK